MSDEELIEDDRGKVRPGEEVRRRLAKMGIDEKTHLPIIVPRDPKPEEKPDEQ